MTGRISAHWHGFVEFVDLESYIDHYMWCVGTTYRADDECSFMAWKNVGLKTRVSAKVNMTHGNYQDFPIPSLLSHILPDIILYSTVDIHVPNCIVFHCG
jgi:hypothetical protein